MAWLWWIAGGGMFFLLSATWIAYTTNPWTPWQLAGQQDARTIDLLPAPAAAGGVSDGVVAIPGLPADAQAIAPANVPVAPGMVSDHTRYQLARAAGWSPEEATLATAISIAENTSGNPVALSPPNWNKTVDAGLWQVNSSHWLAYGGLAVILTPDGNARAARGIYLAQGWCAWSTYESSCGAGHNSAYRAYLARARAAAHDDPAGQA